jgi:hypothetical protein
MSERTTCVLLRLARVAVLWAGGYVLLVTIWGIFHFLLLSFIAVIAGVVMKVQMDERGMLPVRQAKNLLWLYTLIVALSLVAASYYYAPGPMFRRHVMDPVPASVQLLDAQHNGQRDASAYIHFTASPEDLERIIREGEYKLVENPDTNSAAQALSRFKYFLRPDWFRPNLQKDWVHYLRLNKHIDSYDIFYSPSTGEAYYIWLNF